MKTLTAADIADRPRGITAFNAPDMDGVFRLRDLSCDQATYFQCLCRQKTEEGASDFRGLRETLIIMALVDEEGEPLYPHDLDNPASLKAGLDGIGGLPADLVEKLFQAVQEANGLADVEDQVEDIAGN